MLRKLMSTKELERNLLLFFFLLNHERSPKMRWRDAFRLGMVIGVGTIGYEFVRSFASAGIEVLTKRMEKSIKEREQKKWRDAAEERKESQNEEENSL